MKSYVNYMEASRAGWMTDADAPNLDQLKFGALQRIANATERMSQNVGYLIDKAQRLTEENARLKRQLAGVRGEITKLRKAQNAAT